MGVGIIMFIMIICVPFRHPPKSPLCPSPIGGTLVSLSLAVGQSIRMDWVGCGTGKQTPGGQQGLEGKTVKPLHSPFLLAFTLSSNFFLFPTGGFKKVKKIRGEKSKLLDRG